MLIIRTTTTTALLKLLLVHPLPSTALRTNPLISGTRSLFTTSPCYMLEVEQKFVIADAEAIMSMESKLSDLGMTKIGESSMVDWYFDLNVPTLTLLDMWLRYREVLGSDGMWQLKTGSRRHQGGVTVYEEIEGDEAVHKALSSIKLKNRIVSTRTAIKEYEGYQVPDLPDPACGLAPFCRLETKRSTWCYPPNDSRPLVVALDETNYGYMVGEVEELVETNHEIPAARQRIEEFLHFLIPNENLEAGPAVGKLEHYLMEHRPEHYQACVKSGSIQPKT